MPPVRLEDLQQQPPQLQDLTNIYKKLGFRQYHQLQEESKLPAAEQPPAYTRELINSEAALKAFVAKITAAKAVAFDTETTSLERNQLKCVGISLATKLGDEQYSAYIPIRHAGNEPQLAPNLVAEMLSPLMENSDISKIAHNLKFDRFVLQTLGIHTIANFQDTLLLDYVLQAHQGHKLDELALKYLGKQLIPYSQVTNGGKLNFAEVAIEQALDYACEDAEATLEIYEFLANKLLKAPKKPTKTLQPHRAASGAYPHGDGGKGNSVGYKLFSYAGARLTARFSKA